MLKKIIALSLCLVVLALTLCACADEPQNSGDNTSVVSSDSDNQSTENPSDVSSEPTGVITPDRLSAMGEWQRAYVDFIETKKDDHSSYALVYIDDDDIPELYMSGICEATGDGVYSLKNGAIIEQRLGRIGGGSYIERRGMFANQNGSQGACYTDVYELTDDGFTKIFNAVSIEKVKTAENGDLTLSYEYSVEEKKVDKVNYEKAVNESFDFSKSKPLNKNAVSYEEILKQIENYK